MQISVFEIEEVSETDWKKCFENSKQKWFWRKKLGKDTGGEFLEKYLVIKTLHTDRTYFCLAKLKFQCF